jgi:hypothetical protein
MKIIKLCNIFNKYAYGVLNVYTFNNLVESYINETNIDFIKCLYKLYQLHDALEIKVRELHKLRLPNNFNDIMERTINELQNLKIQTKKISSQDIEEYVDLLIKKAEIAIKYFDELEYSEQGSGFTSGLKDAIGAISAGFQQRLHEFLDKVTFSYVNYLKGQRNILQ